MSDTEAGCEECGNDIGPYEAPDGRKLCLDCMEELHG